MLFECALLLPDTPFVVVMSSRSPAIHPPPNVEVLKDLPPGKFNGYLEASKAVVVPLAEDTGSSGQMVALTAMSFARPLIVTKLPAVMEYLEDGVSGLCYEPGDVESLRLALLKVLTSPETALTMGQQARIRYLTRFTPATYADHILSCLQAPARL